MSDVDTLEAGDTPEARCPGAMAGPVETNARPLMMTDTYVEVNGVNLKCLSLSVSLEVDNNPITQTTFCGVQEYPRPHRNIISWRSSPSRSTRAAPTQALSAAVAAYARRGRCRVQGPPVRVEAGGGEQPRILRAS